MTTALERRYATLLRAYPARHRHGWGSDILTTLMDRSSPGQRRPSWREAASLVRGGLRARAGADMRRTPAQLALSVAKLALLFLLVYAAAQVAGSLLKIPIGVTTLYSADLESYVVELAPPMLVLALYAGAMVAAARDRYLLGAALAVAAFLPNTLLFTPVAAVYLMVSGEWWPIPLAVPVALALAFFRHREPGNVLGWLAAIPAGVFLLPTVVSQRWALQPWGVLILAIGVGAWSTIDVRLPIGVLGSLAVLGLLQVTALSATAWDRLNGLFIVMDLGWALLPAALAVPAALMARRQARL